MIRMGRLGRLFLLLLTASWALAQNPPMTTISDIVYEADGTPGQGVLLISWPEFTTAGNQAVAAGTTTTTLRAGGALSVQLVSNANAMPANTVYTVVYQLSEGVRTEYWVVPATSPATLAQVRTVLGAPSGASQMASQQYVQSAVAGKANDSAVVHLAGTETITGVKQFSVSPSLPAPVNPTDAASKQYVDNSVQNSGSGSYVSIAGSTMTGPLILSGAPTSPSQAATKNYADLGLASKADLVSGTVPLSELGAVATLDVNGNVVQNANTATQFKQTPTQCNGAFVTGVQANGNANCSTADVVQLAETTQPSGIPNYGIFWFDSTCHCPKVIDNNGQPVQLGLLNVFNFDANTLEERNGTTPQTFRIYQTTDAPEANYSRLSLGFDSTNLRYSVSADYAGTGSAYGIEFKLGSTVPWYISSNFNLLTGTDNQRDIGADALGNGNNGLGIHSLYYATALDGEMTGGSANDWPNDPTTGTAANKLAKLTAAGAAVTTATSDVGGAIGVVIAGAGTTYNAEVVSSGFALCIFDGATTIGDYVQISGTVAGDCHDAGSTYPTGGQVLGRVMVTNAAGGNYKTYFFGAGVQGSTSSTNTVASVFGRIGSVTAQNGDYSVSQVTGAAPLASPALTGTPTAPTATPLTNNTQIATTAYTDSAISVEKARAQAAEALLAPLASPALTGTPTAPTPSTGDSSTKIATTAWVNAQGYGVGTGNVSGPATSTNGDIATFYGTNGKTIQDAGVAVSSLAPLASPAFTGTPTAPTPSTPDNSAKLATTAYVKAQGYGTGSVASVTASAPFTSSGGATPNISASLSGTGNRIQTTNVGPSTSGDIATWDANGNSQDSGTELSSLAPLASPAFTGTPTAPTPATLDSSTKIATTAWVNAQGFGTSGGNVSGPASSVVNELPVFSVTNGKTIAESHLSANSLPADCSMAPGSDAGTQVSNCITNAGGTGQYNATGITGAVAVNGTSLILSGNPTGELLLGRATYWLTGSASTIVIPTRFHIKGIGTSIQSSDYNTIIRACNGQSGPPCNGTSFPSNTPMFCYGQNGQCGGVNGNGGSMGFDSWIRGVKVDCNNVSGCIGVQNEVAQENSGVYDSDIVNWGNGGIGLQVINGITPAWQASTAYALNWKVQPTSSNGHYYQATTAGTSGSTQPSWPTNGGTVNDGTVVWTDEGTNIPATSPANSDYARLVVQHAMSATCTTGAVGIMVNTWGYGSIKKIENVTVNTPGCSTQTTSDIVYDGGGGTLRDLHLESALNGVTLGANVGAQGVTIDGIYTGITQNQVNISNAYASQTGDILLRNITGCCHILNDQINSYNPTKASESGAIGMYYMGHPASGVLITSAATIPSKFGNTVSFTTPSAGDNSTKGATTAWVQGQGYGTASGLVSGNYSKANGGASVTDSGVAAGPYASFWGLPGSVSTTTPIACSSTAGKATIWGISLVYPLKTSNVTYYVNGADNSANTYDMGLYSASGSLVVHTGSLAGTTFAPTASHYTGQPWTTANTVIQPGNYYLALTCSATTGTATFGYTYTWAANANTNESVSSGGSLPSSITVPGSLAMTNAVTLQVVVY